MYPLPCICIHQVYANNRCSASYSRAIRPYRIYPYKTSRVLVVRTRNVNVHLNPYRRACRKIGRKRPYGLIITVRIRRLLRTVGHCRTFRNLRLVFTGQTNLYVFKGKRVCRPEVLYKKIYRIAIRRRIYSRIAAVIAQRTEVSYRCIKCNVNPSTSTVLHLLKRQDYRREVCTAVIKNGIHPRNRRGCILVIIRGRGSYALRNKFTRNHNIHFYSYSRTCRKVGGKPYSRLIILRSIRRTVRHVHRHLYVFIDKRISGCEAVCYEEYRITKERYVRCCIGSIQAQYVEISYRCREGYVNPLSYVCVHVIVRNKFSFFVHFAASRSPYRIQPRDIRVLVVRTRDIYVHIYRYGRANGQVGGKSCKCLSITTRSARLITAVNGSADDAYVLIVEGSLRFEALRE